MVQALWLALLWAMQLRGGVRREGKAKRGARFLHPLVQLALGQGADADPRTRSALDEFLARQCLLVVASLEEACVYVLASRLDVYVGITATSRVTACTATSGAACRYWEHLVEIRKLAARGPSAERSRKVACFRRRRAGHVAMLVVALGPRSEVARATAIASGGCRGNTAGARGAGLMPRRHRALAGRARTRQPRPRRAGLPDALRATVHWLALADGRLRRSEDREPRREAGRLTDRLRDLPFAEQYAAWQRARWHLGLSEGPVDVLGTRGDTLLAAWFAGAGQVCYGSLLQRAAGDDLVALRACDAVQGMRHADGKRRALDRVSRLLRLWRLPARGAKVTRWLGPATGCTAASALEDVRARLTGRGRRLWHWVRERTRVVLPRCQTQTYAWHWNHIRCARASEMLGLLATGAAERPPRPEAQAGMVRVKRYWRLQVAISPAQARRQGRGEVSMWARKCFGASFRCPGRPRAGLRGGPGEAAEATNPLRDPGPGDELANYRAHLTRPADGEVLVQEDKDKSAAWRMPARAPPRGGCRPLAPCRFLGVGGECSLSPSAPGAAPATVRVHGLGPPLSRVRLQLHEYMATCK